MKKLLIIYLIISFLMVFVYAIFVVNAYVSIKYEVETIDNDRADASKCVRLQKF